MGIYTVRVDDPWTMDFRLGWKEMATNDRPIVVEEQG